MANGTVIDITGELHEVESIPLVKAMLVWNPGTEDDVQVVPLEKCMSYAKLLNENAPYAHVGSTVPSTPDKPHNYLFGLLFYAWLAIQRDGLNPLAVHDALLAVPEYANAWNDYAGKSKAE